MPLSRLTHRYNDRPQIEHDDRKSTTGAKNGAFRRLDVTIFFGALDLLALFRHSRICTCTTSALPYCWLLESALSSALGEGRGTNLALLFFQ